MSISYFFVLKVKFNNNQYFNTVLLCSVLCMHGVDALGPTDNRELSAIFEKSKWVCDNTKGSSVVGIL